MVTQEEVKLIAIGATFALGLSLSAFVFPKLLLRVAGDLGLLVLAAVALYILGLTIDGDPLDFLSVDIGIVLVVGAFGLGGVIPPVLSSHREFADRIGRDRKRPSRSSR